MNGIDATIKTGLKHRETLRVEERHTVPRVDPAWEGFADMPPVLATAILIGFIENTCAQALKLSLPPGRKTVGTYIDMTHTSPTPVGMEVVAEINLIEITGRKLIFKITARDESGLIGEGIHHRVIIETKPFMERVAQKKSTV